MDLHYMNTTLRTVLYALEENSGKVSVLVVILLVITVNLSCKSLMLPKHAFKT